ncbi:MAG: DUF1501 domain-containing protein [Planctomycetales bacterium]|nr:DUF1501 domain-containing protein [Planctomycetales bacterium]MCA9206858.1 DUF1501 domain-containing protein [Planctomycetales bacterium]MCA9227410.1 DUF1501 domain-containing protein [Planctomycetales bacterium]
MKTRTARCAGPVSRRTFLQIGSMAVGGLGFGDMLRLRSQAAAATAKAEPDTSVIFVWLPGGPPHMETYDMKPNAPLDYRGDFRPISTNVPGIDVCELLPMHAKIADRYTLIRSVAHEFADHGGGHKRFLTGRKPAEPTGFVNDAPAVGSIVAKMREHRNNGLPNYISGTNPGRAGVDVYSFGAAYLGPSYVPFNVPGDPSDEKFEVRNLGLDQSMSERLDDRVRLLEGFDRFRRDVDQSGAMNAVDQFNGKALELLTSDDARRAFDLTLEPDAVRERYGRHAWGQRALMARRLVEAGCSFVTMVMENPYQSGVSWLKNGTYNWDSHAVNCHLFDDARIRMPIYDRAVTALVEDIYARGLDKKVMLIVTGEFGRTPRINSQTGTQTGVSQPGRDHWPGAMSMLVAGGGIKTGQVIGATNTKGEYPVDQPLSPNDLWATVYRHLGIDYTRAFPDHNGRPMPILPFGEPIEALF